MISEIHVYSLYREYRKGREFRLIEIIINIFGCTDSFLKIHDYLSDYSSFQERSACLAIQWRRYIPVLLCSWAQFLNQIEVFENDQETPVSKMWFAYNSILWLKLFFYSPDIKIIYKKNKINFNQHRRTKKLVRLRTHN